MAAVNLNSVSFSYAVTPGAFALDDVNLSVDPGEVVVLCGSSGCGKTTITRVVNGLVPHFYSGSLAGEISVCGLDPVKDALEKTAAVVGSVFQNPKAQFFTTDVLSELVFACENLGMPEELIVSRLEGVILALGLEGLRERGIFALSGGEKQALACGSVYMPDPQVVVLDEPSSNLDVKATKDLGELIRSWKAQGKSVVIAEHNLEYLVDIADRFCYLRGGRIECEFTPAQLCGLSFEELQDLGLRTPTPWSLLLPEALPTGDDGVSFSNVTCVYPQVGKILNVDHIAFAKGAITGLVGENGSGKTTLARFLAGLEPKAKGLVTFGGRKLSARARRSQVYLVTQNVSHQLFTESVEEEVLLSMKKEDRDRARAILASLDLAELAKSHPMALSGGEKQRVAIAAALASERPIVVLDEPTSGLDLRHMHQVADALRSLSRTGVTVIVITHDQELVATCCTAIHRIQDGQVVSGE
ncbi:MAG: energy-coupling factor ABC transporter ATP-binding protein [Propionibacteriaceae bacterium]|jgi:energy-coupling factor transport system ATP-binding protein|nr:energy-coupling factor ABC transporter ATP-binding protein [Propionibacteriaceae bacterium]